MAITKKVLVTGISGFLGSHTAIQLLKKGYEVTGTLRSLKRAESIRDLIEKQGADISKLHFLEADLQDAALWDRAMKGMDYVQHIASPFPKKMPKHEDDLIKPAVEGNLNILRAAAKHKVQRVVITSSIAAIEYGKPASQRNATFSETDWTNENASEDLTPYYKSKTIAEKAAWGFQRSNIDSPEIAVVCPGLILGPLLEEDFSASSNVVIKLLDGSMPGIPAFGFEVIDVRSVAELQILAMEKPEAANQRYVSTAGFMEMQEIAGVVKSAFPSRKVPSKRLPDWLVRLFSIFDGTLKPVLIDLGIQRRLNNNKAIRELGWIPINPREAIISNAKSVIELGLVKAK